jgi:hypothetical protein
MTLFLFSCFAVFYSPACGEIWKSYLPDFWITARQGREVSVYLYSPARFAREIYKSYKFPRCAFFYSPAARDLVDLVDFPIVPW